MNYLKVPDSNIKLTDGSVVMLARFPGTKWVVHYGWYDYSGRRRMGWYFSSIPAQTVIPVTNQDLQLIVLIDPSTSDYPEDPIVPPAPPVPGPSPCPGPGPGPRPCPGPMPEPGGLFPEDPNCPPSPDSRAYFSKNDQYLLDCSFISLPSIKYRDALSTICKIPDGKLVKVNDAGGVARYFSWNAADNRWDEKFFENDTEKFLVNYYTKEEIDEFLGAINISINSLEAADVVINNNISGIRNDLSDLSHSVDADIGEITGSLSAETAARVEGDANIRSDINDLESDLQQETSARIAADDAEALARRNAVDAERIARVAADDAIETKVNALESAITGYDIRFDVLSDADQQLEDEITALTARVAALEAAVFSIRSIIAAPNNTVLVSDEGTLKDSGVSIGDDYIGEPSDYASANTLATEKAVAKKVEDNVTQWTSF